MEAESVNCSFCGTKLTIIRRKRKMENRARELGKITKASVEFEDHGILSFMLHFSFKGSAQGFGGVSLDNWSKQHNRRIGTAAGLDLMIQLMKLFEVSRFEDIAGKHAYALRDNNEWNASITGVERTEPEGSGKFLLKDWRNQWHDENV